MATTIPKDGLRTIIASISELPEAYILWDGEAKGPVDLALGGARRLTLGVLSRIPVGWDEEKREYVADPNNLPDGLLLKLTQSGQRRVTVTFKAENFAQEEGFDFLEQIRTLLAASDVRESISGLGCAVSDIGTVRTIQGYAGNRKISVAQMDLFLNQFVSVVRTMQGDTFIETVETDGEVYP